MSLRAKLIVALVLLSTLATVAVGATTYRSTGRVLREEVDRSLQDAVTRTLDRGVRDRYPDRDAGPEPPRSEGDVVQQYVGPAGATVPLNGVSIPVRAGDLAVARSERPVGRYRDDRIGSTPVRVLTAGPGGSQGAVQAARSLAEVQRVLTELGRRTLLTVVVVGALAALAGALVARQVTRRLARLTAAAESVAATGDLAVGVPVQGHDETGRLGTAFNDMLSALARSRDEQRRLVQDAGHELRTPLTSLRTNVFALDRAEQLTEDQRRRLLEDLRTETEELTALVNEVVELATERREDEPVAPVALAPLAERVAERARRRTGREVVVQADDGVVLARESALERAVSNLVENACKFDTTGGAIHVTVARGEVWVEDRGPGIPPEDVPRVFDRFHRATAARAMPGSGLGLSIVREVVESAGGAVAAGNRPEGGAIVGFRLPLAADVTATGGPTDPPPGDAGTTDAGATAAGAGASGPGTDPVPVAGEDR